MKNYFYNPTAISSFLISVLIFSFMLIHGYGMIIGDEKILLGYLKVYAKEPIQNFSVFFYTTLNIIGVIQWASAAFLFITFMKNESLGIILKKKYLQWGIFLALISITFYGALVRYISNQSGAAHLFYFSSLLFLFLSWLKATFNKRNTSSFKISSLLPIYLLIFYTMGFPGWTKIFGGRLLKAKYVSLFKDTFISKLPGAVPMIITTVGIIELLVPLLLILSLLKGEFKEENKKLYFNTALVITILHFSLLSFGLSILFNIPGSANLIFYAIFTFLILIAANYQKKYLN